MKKDVDKAEYNKYLKDFNEDLGKDIQRKEKIIKQKIKNSNKSFDRKELLDGLSFIANELDEIQSKGIDKLNPNNLRRFYSCLMKTRELAEILIPTTKEKGLRKTIINTNDDKLDQSDLIIRREKGLVYKE